MDDPLVQELRRQAALAWPLSLGNVLMRSFSVMSMIFVGQLCSSELFAAASLGNTFANVTGHSLMVGLSSGLATLASQAHGAKDYRNMNLALQRSIVILGGACIPISALWFWSNEFLFYICNQEADVSRAASAYLRAFIPSLWLYAILQCLQTWLQSQGITRPIAWTATISALLHPLVNYVLIVPLKMGYIGSAVSNALTQLVWLAMLLGYIFGSGLAKRVDLKWRPREGFQELRPYMALALPGMLMLAEWWAAESIILLGGRLPNAEANVSVLSIYQTVNAVAYMISFGIHVAANTRVGNNLGSGDARMAKLSAHAAPFLSSMVGGAMAVILRLLQPYYPYAFTSDKTVVTMTQKTTLVACFLIFADAVQAACTGILKGSGKQRVGWISTVLSYFGVGVPLATLLSFRFHLGPVGLCIGLAVGCYCYMLSTLGIVVWTNWDDEVIKARKRLVRPKEGSNSSSSSLGGGGSQRFTVADDAEMGVDVEIKGKEQDEEKDRGAKARPEEVQVQQQYHWSTSTGSDDDSHVLTVEEDDKVVMEIEDRRHPAAAEPR